MKKIHIVKYLLLVFFISCGNEDIGVFNETILKNDLLYEKYF